MTVKFIKEVVGSEVVIKFINGEFTEYRAESMQDAEDFIKEIKSTFGNAAFTEVKETE